MALYNATNGDHWTNNHNWTRDVDLDEWHGVTTDPSGRIVLELDLGENELFGTLPPELGDLSNLRRLGLGDNQLQEEIPSELGNLAELRYLSLTRNLLRGEIPWELGNLTYLEVLGLGRNDLEGEIPSELGNLANLRELYLWGNRLRGEIPPDLGNLSALEKLHLQDNLLEGSIPLELGDLTNLKELDLSGNAALSGCMPEGSAVGSAQARPTAVEGGRSPRTDHHRLGSCGRSFPLQHLLWDGFWQGHMSREDLRVLRRYCLRAALCRCAVQTRDFFDEVYWIATL